LISGRTVENEKGRLLKAALFSSGDIDRGATQWIVPGCCVEMITFFNITGSMYYVDEDGENIGYEDVFTKTGMCRKHYSEVGLGAGYVNQFIR